jgi:hypothetical protein
MQIALTLLAVLFVIATFLYGTPHYEVLLLIPTIAAAALSATSSRAGAILVIGTPALDSFAILTSYPQVITVFQVMLIATISGAIFRRVAARRLRVPRLTMWDVGILIFVVAAWLSVPLSGSLRVSVIGAIEVTALATMYAFLTTTIDVRSRYSDLFLTLTAVGAISAIAGLGQAFVPGFPVPLLEEHITGNPVVVQRVSAFFANPNAFAVMLLPPILLLLEAILRERSRNRRIVLGLLIILMTAGLGVSFSREAMIGLVVASLSLALMIPASGRKRLRVAIAIAVVFALTGAVASVSQRAPTLLDIRADASAMDRVYLSQASMRMFVDNPLTGTGVSSFMYAYPPYADSRVTIDPVPNGHQMPFAIPAEMGLAGLLAEIVMAVALVRTVSMAPSAAAEGVQVGGVAAAVAFFVMSFANGFIFCEAFWVTLAIVGSVLRAMKEASHALSPEHQDDPSLGRVA